MELQGNLAIQANRVSLEAPDSLVVRDRKEPSDPTDRLEVRETLGRLDWLDLQERQDNLDCRVRVDSPDSRVIQVRWVTLEHLGLLEIPEILDNVGRKVPSDHPDQMDWVAIQEHQELKVMQGHKDNLDFPDSQVLWDKWVCLALRALLVPRDSPDLAEHLASLE